MFGDVAMGVDHNKFETILEKQKELFADRNNIDISGVKDTDLTVEDLTKIVAKYKQMYKNDQGRDFPEDPKQQL